MVAMSKIKELAEQIAKQFEPERIVLFGSYAHGTPGPDSDVDLLVIMDFEGKSFWKSLEIANFVNPSFPVDLLARRPGDTERRYTLGDPLIKEALDHGQVLYERSRSGMD
jgi:predicted nucleotidyltransferase